MESIALKYNMPSRYKIGERIDPQVEIWCGGELVGTFPMEYTVESYAPSEDTSGEETPAPMGTAVLTVLKWVGIVLGTLVLVLLVLRAYFMTRRRRRARRRRQAQNRQGRAR